MKSLSLWKISEALESLEYFMEDENIPAEQRELAIQQYFETEEALEKKVENSCNFLQNIDTTTDAIKGKIKDLQGKVKALETKKENFKRYLIMHLKKHNKPTLKFPEFTMKLSQTPGAVEIRDEGMIDAKYLEVIPETRRVMKAEILKDLRAGNFVSGARLVKKDKLTIK